MTTYGTLLPKTTSIPVFRPTLFLVAVVHAMATDFNMTATNLRYQGSKDLVYDMADPVHGIKKKLYDIGIMEEQIFVVPTSSG